MQRATSARCQPQHSLQNALMPALGDLPPTARRYVLRADFGTSASRVATDDLRVGARCESRSCAAFSIMAIELRAPVRRASLAFARMSVLVSVAVASMIASMCLAFLISVGFQWIRAFGRSDRVSVLIHRLACSPTHPHIPRPEVRSRTLGGYKGGARAGAQCHLRFLFFFPSDTGMSIRGCATVAYRTG